MSIETIPFRHMESAVIHTDEVEPAGVEEIRVIQRLLLMYEMAQREKSRWTRSWETSYKFYMGQHWGDRPDWKASPVLNHIFSVIETMVPILTDNRPKVDILPRTPDYAEYSTIMQRMMDWLWGQLEMDNVTVEVTKNTLLFGKGFYYIYWDSEAGDIRIESVDPQLMFPDPWATTTRNTRFLIHADLMSHNDIADQFGQEAAKKAQRGARLIPDPNAFKKDFAHRDSQNITTGYEYPQTSGGALSRAVPWVKSDLQGGTDEDDMIQVLQYWIRDNDLITDDLKDPNSGKILRFPDGAKAAVQRKKFPNGRHIVLAGNRIIHDEENPFEHGRWPYVEQNCHIVPGEFWPVSAVQNLISPQMGLNKTMGQIVDNKNLMGSAQWLVDKNSGVKRHQLTGQPGIVIFSNPGARVERLTPPALPSYVIQAVSMYREALDNISGVFDVTQGRKPGGITAGVAIEQLQEAAQTRLRLLVRNLEGAHRQIGYHEIALAQQFYEEARQIRITDPETGEFRFEEVTPEMLKAQWEVQVAAGSTLPRSREARQREALALHERGLFDEQAVLEWIEHPQAEKLLARLKANQDRELELALATGGQGGTVGGAQGGGTVLPAG